jgi:F-type H+-transporting ATPase subunit b
MIFLSAGSELINPGIGLVFWMLVTFVILIFLLKKYAWKPILNAVNKREEDIISALTTAEKAKREMESLKVDNEKLLAEARAERDAIMREARDIRKQILDDAKDKAQVQTDKMYLSAKEAIDRQKEAVLFDMKKQISLLALEISEKVIKQELSNKDSQQQLVQRMLDETKLN